MGQGDAHTRDKLLAHAIPELDRVALKDCGEKFGLLKPAYFNPFVHIGLIQQSFSDGSQKTFIKYGFLIKMFTGSKLMVFVHLPAQGEAVTAGLLDMLDSVVMKFCIICEFS